MPEEKILVISNRNYCERYVVNHANIPKLLHTHILIGESQKCIRACMCSFDNMYPRVVV